jgi:hypothetical protein
VTAPPHSVLEAARTSAGMSFIELWIAYFALGGAAQPQVVRSYLGGGHAGSFDYDVLAHAINERYVEHGLNHPVPYFDELR